MHWRMQLGQDWEREKGARNKRAFKARIESGQATGVMAFARRADDSQSLVGWCAAGPREQFPKLLRARATKPTRSDAWAAVCFFIPAAERSRGVASALLEGAVQLAGSQGAKVIEGYPVLTKQGQRYPSTFAFVGVPRLFEKAGFRAVEMEGATRPTWKRNLRPRRP